MTVALTVSRDGVVVGAHERAVVPGVRASSDGSRTSVFTVVVRMHGALVRIVRLCVCGERSRGAWRRRAMSRVAQCGAMLLQRLYAFSLVFAGLPVRESFRSKVHDRK